MTELKKSLGFITILSLSISSVAGTTFFFGAGIGAQLAGNLAIVGWIILSILAVYIAATFGELAAMFPKAGGAYEFGKQAYGRFISFVIGWTAWLVGNISVVVMVVAAINAFALDLNSFELILASILLILILNAIAYIGIEASAFVMVVLAAITIGIAFFIITGGVIGFNRQYVTDLITHNPLSIFVVIFFLTESYFGWEGATYLSEETRNARRIIPKALIMSTVIIGILGALVIFLTLGSVGWQQAAENVNPVALLMTNIFGELGKNITAIGIFLTLMGAAAGSIITMPRLLLSLARDRLFLGHLKEIHPRYNTPFKAIRFQIVVIILFLFMGLGSYEILLNLLVPLALIMYIFLILSVPILRRKMPNAERTFKVPFGSVGPILVSMLFLAMMIAWLLVEPNSLAFLNLSISLIMLSLPLFLLVEVYYDPKAITGINDVLAYFSLLTEKITYPGEIKVDILTFLGNIKGRTVLEYGCGVGSLTIPLLKEVGSSGKIYATHFSVNHLKIAKKRVENVKWESEQWEYGEVKIIHDPQHFIRVHPDIGEIDAVVSVGMLGYLQNLDEILKQLYVLLPSGGKICFVEYGDFFHVIPNVEWLGSDRAIAERFRKAGFSVRVVRKKSLFWDRIFIYGVKFDKDIAMI